MGTLLWFESQHRLFRLLLEPLTERLAQARHVGDVAINCLFNEHEIFPLEFTTRFGWPATQAQVALQRSPWAEVLYDLALVRPSRLKWSRGFSMALLIAVPPFPFAPPADARGSRPRGMEVHFEHPLTPEEHANIHFDSVEFLPCPQGVTPVLSDSSGCGRSISAATNATP